MGRKNKKRAAKKRDAKRKHASASLLAEFPANDSTRAVLPCLHGSLPPASLRRQEAEYMMNKYFNKRFSPELRHIPLAYINFQFFVHNRDSVGTDMAALVLHDAANHALKKHYQPALLFVHLHVWLDKWLQGGKPQVPIPFAGNDEEEGRKSSIWHEIPMAVNEIGTPGEICSYIHKRIPCGCLKKAKKAAKKEVLLTNCYGCNKEGTHSEFIVCADCKGATYCCRECQAAHWDDHRARCRYVQGKEVSADDKQKNNRELLLHLTQNYL